MSSTYPQEIALIDHFVRQLERWLAGRHTPRLVNRLPIDECHLGVLVPWRTPEEEDPLDDDEKGSAATPPEISAFPTSSIPPSVASEAVDSEEKTSGLLEKRSIEDTSTRRPPSSLGCELLLHTSDRHLEVELDVQFAVFTLHLPTLNEQMHSQGQVKMPHDEPAEVEETGPDKTMSLAEVYERQDVEVKGIRITLDVNENALLNITSMLQRKLNEVVEEALTRNPMPVLPHAKGKVPTPPQIPTKILVNEATFKTYLQSLSAQHPPRRPDPALQVAVKVRSEQVTPKAARVSIYVSNETMKGEIRTQDNINILADVRIQGRVIHGEIQPIEILPIPKDYQYDRRVWGVGHNTSVEVNPKEKTFKTQALARFDQQRLTTKEHLKATFEALHQNPMEVLTSIRMAMCTEVKHWQEQVIGLNTENLSQEELGACLEDLEKFKEEVNRFSAGVAALQASPELMASFKAMNRAMGRIAKFKNFDQWRLFQICFIVTQLPALALREGISSGEWPAGTQHNWLGDEDTADVLWFPTGGGKTESYLGLICCAMIFDRLRGKTLGVTAWLRFPLRMLSIQQLQRAMQMVHEAQKEVDGLIPGNTTDPLRIGYFVGSTSTPNSFTSGFFDRHKTPEDCEKYQVVTDCPHCQQKRTVKVHPEPKAQRLIHKCTACGYELPLVITDVEIYRTLPALLIGTVDKMATVGLQAVYGILWAGPKWKCPTHGYGIGEYCVFGCTESKNKGKTTLKASSVFPKIQAKDPVPTLHLQDELHLLQEELGAFAGHYETLIRHCEKMAGKAKAKIVAATATIEGFEHQARHLYGVKGARRFPGRGYRRHESFYTQLERISADTEGTKAARVFVAFRPSGTSIEAASRCARVLGAEITRLIEHPEEVKAALPGNAPDSVIKDLTRYYSMTLTYVGSLQGGTRVKDLLSSASTETLNNRDLELRYLSGRSTSGEISTVIDEIENGDWKSPHHVDALIATNVISHGVDLERCNLMVMEKFPAETAEYIQASSRSGRKKVGLVVVVLPSHNLRATSIYNRFKEHHQHLDRMVNPVPVNRFSRYALQRTLPGIMSGLLYGISNPLHNTVDHKKLKPALDRIEDAMTKGKMLGLLEGAQALGEHVYDRDLEGSQRELLHELFQGVLNNLKLQKNQKDKLNDALQPKPMTSLRDVERGVPFVPAENNFKLMHWFEKATE